MNFLYVWAGKIPAIETREDDKRICDSWKALKPFYKKKYGVEENIAIYKTSTVNISLR